MGTNGNMGFSLDSGGGYNQDNRIPSTWAPNNRITAFYEDLTGPLQAYGACKSMGGKVSTFDDAANDRFIVQYTNWADYNSCTQVGGSANTFQIVLSRSGPWRCATSPYHRPRQTCPAAYPRDLGGGHGGYDRRPRPGGPGNVANQTAWLFRPVAVHTIVYTGVVRSDLAPAAVTQQHRRHHSHVSGCEHGG